MANVLTVLLPKLLAMALPTLRENSIMPRLVNRSYEDQAAQKGDTVTIPIASAVTAGDVTPSNVPPTTPDTQPTSVSLVLDQWKEGAFYLSDKDVQEVVTGGGGGVIPMQAAEAVKSLVNLIDQAILSAARLAVYNMAGTPGTTPFITDEQAYLDAREILNRNLAPMSDRAVVLGTAAEAKALGLRAFQDTSWRGDREGIIEGNIGRKLGADWWMNQNVPTHTGGTASGATTSAAGFALGVKTVALASAGTGTILVGDIITFAGQTQQYVVTAGDASVADGGSISFEPGLKTAIPTATTAITLAATRVENLLFHRDAFAFASRPMLRDAAGLGNYDTITDPISGITLRLEVTREHKRDRFSYDILYGIKVVRPELAVVIAG